MLVKTSWRKLSLVALDMVMLTGAYVFAFHLRVGSHFSLGLYNDIGRSLPVLLAVSFVVHMRLGLFNAILRFASIDTAITIFKSVLYSVLITALAVSVLGIDQIRPGVLTIYGMAAVLLLGGSRMMARVLENRHEFTGKERRVVLYGANETTDIVLRGWRFLRQSGCLPVAIIDNDSTKHGHRIHGVEIGGGLAHLRDLAKTHDLQEVWVCVPGLSGAALRDVYEAAAPLNLRVKILPRLEHALIGSDLNRFHDVEIADLLRRPTRRLDPEGMRRWVKDRRVLITGAGGTIGSELARQVARLGPRSLALCDSSEAGLFQIHGELASRHGGMILAPYLVNVCESPAVDRMFREVKPEIVFHAAAYKHVPLVELNPCEGIRTNVQGLMHTCLAAVEHGTTAFVFISTDKAVRPVNVMGATKRIGELICQVLNREGSTRFMVVRFGNVLGSSGSVVPIFQEQIRQGKPVTVTHPDMTRFFMLISEAVELVIQSGSIGRGGEIFLLDMGKPVRIAQMAEDLIRLMGKEPGRDIPITFVGTRPGEKIHEEILLSKEDARTQFPDIWIDHEAPPSMDWATFRSELDILLEAANGSRREDALLALKRLLPLFAPLHPETEKMVAPADVTVSAAVPVAEAIDLQISAPYAPLQPSE